MEKNSLLAMAAVAVLAVLAFALFYNGNAAPQPEEPAGPAMPEEVPVPLRAAAVEAQLARIIASNNQTEGVRKTTLPAETFAQLPEFPKDFYRIELLNRYGHLTEKEQLWLPEEYWKQPEWYIGYAARGEGMAENASGGAGAVYGYGAYKADEWRTVRAGDNFTAVVYIHASWAVKSYQGFEMGLAYNESGFENVAVAPEIFLLAPTWPAFNANWTQKVVVAGRVREDAAPGEYVVAMDAQKPPEEWAAQWREAYTYSEPTFQMGFGRPMFQLHLTVAEKAG